LEIKIDIGMIEQLLTMVDRNNLEELDIRCGDCKVLIKKRGSQPAVHLPPVQVSKTLPDKKIARQQEKEESGFIQVVAPLSGVFYRASSPGSPPYVEVGDTVAPGQVLCIIEAMKLMNDITAEVNGTIHRIAAENAQAVEQKQVLIYIKPR
jgi:acetyl-CoA carboxylase biotin carboxyl carrier protein